MDCEMVGLPGKGLLSGELFLSLGPGQPWEGQFFQDQEEPDVNAS